MFNFSFYRTYLKYMRKKQVFLFSERVLYLKIYVPLRHKYRKYNELIINFKIFKNYV